MGGYRFGVARETSFQVLTGPKAFLILAQTTGRHVDALVADSLRTTCLPGTVFWFGGFNAVGSQSLGLIVTCLVSMLFFVSFFLPLTSLGFCTISPVQISTTGKIQIDSEICHQSAI